MGNSNRKSETENQVFIQKNIVNRNNRFRYFSQLSLSNLANNLSGRSFISLASHQSNYSVSRPWSRISRHRWKESTLTEPFELCKTAWPVANIEAVFLPDFPINNKTNENNFEKIELISHGAYGQVFKVKQIDTNEIFALKVLSKSQIINEKAVRQVKEEVSIQKLCGHNPFIVGCCIYWQNRRKLFIVSEYIGGGELFDLLHKYGALPELLVQVYVAEVALALDFLHNAGIIYRDLKAENILLDEDSHIKLIDFGLSKWLKYGERTNTLCGTLRYMAPEIASLTPYGHAADWWSLGVLMCVMLLNDYPVPAIPQLEVDFKGMTLQDNKSNSMPGTLPDKSINLSNYAKHLLMRLLERDPSKRLRSLLTLQHQGFFKDINFADIKSRKISPKQILLEHFAQNPVNLQQECDNNSVFDTFVSNSVLV